MEGKENIRIIISGGGTGGHIFPAIAIANAIKRQKPDAQILFIGAEGKMEMEKVPEAGYPIEGLWISGFQRSLSLKNLSFPFKLIASLRKAKKIMKQFKPDAVIGVGGYASGPSLRAAGKRKIPTLLQEQNSFPGVTNRILAKKAGTICVAYHGLDKFFPKDKIVYTGNPIRRDVVEIAGKNEEAYDFFGLEAHRKTLLIVGGSQGALAINKAIKKNLVMLSEAGMQIIWQTGKPYLQEALDAIDKKGLKNIKPLAFIQRMDLAYAAADLVISRAGAIAISELCATGKPSIFVPLPTAAEDHQTKNAKALVDQNAAVLVSNSEAEEKLGKVVVGLMENNLQRQQLSANIARNGILDADDRIAQEVFKLTEQKRAKRK